MYHAFVAMGSFLSAGCGMCAIVAAIASALHVSRNTEVTTILLEVSNVASVSTDF